MWIGIFDRHKHSTAMLTSQKSMTHGVVLFFLAVARFFAKESVRSRLAFHTHRAVVSMWVSCPEDWSEIAHGLTTNSWLCLFAARMFSTIAQTQQTTELWAWKMEYLHHEQRPL
jgi:hypothetical protein